MKNIKNYELLLSSDRGHAKHSWLDSKHSFSFANYYNPKQMGFSDLRVINDDTIDAGQGFGMHGHENMEIFTYVTSGQLAHKDSMGNTEIIEAGDVQLMSAGRGVRHSEFNASAINKSKLLQIWIYPSEKGGLPSYQQNNFSNEDKKGKLKLIISEHGEADSLSIKQNAKIYSALLSIDNKINFTMSKERSYYLHVVNGELSVNGKNLYSGDALKIFEGEGELVLDNGLNAEVLLFDLNKV